MGVITLALITVGWQSSSEPQLWVIVTCAVAIALGTYSGGWRIIRTLGKGLVEVKPAQGFAAEASTSATILASSALGFALSTTQVASGSVIGTGVGKRGARVQWRTVRGIMIGWMLTLPAAGAVGALAAAIVLWLGGWGIALDAVLALGVILGSFLYAKRQAITAHNAMSDDLIEHPGTRKRRARRQRALQRAEAKKVVR